MQAIAAISVESDCQRADTAWCEENCKALHPTWSLGHPKMQACLSSCQSDADAEVTAFVKALSEITIDTTFACTSKADPVGAIWIAEDLDVRNPGWLSSPLSARIWPGLLAMHR